MRRSSSIRRICGSSSWPPATAPPAPRSECRPPFSPALPGAAPHGRSAGGIWHWCAAEPAPDPPSRTAPDSRSRTADRPVRPRSGPAIRARALRELRPLFIQLRENLVDVPPVEAHAAPRAKRSAAPPQAPAEPAERASSNPCGAAALSVSLFRLDLVPALQNLVAGFGRFIRRKRADGAGPVFR